MKKEEILELVKELFELGSKKEAEAKLAEVDTLVKAVADKLEVGQKAKVGVISLEKALVKGRTGEMTMKDGSKKAWASEDKVVVKAKIK